MTTCASPDDRHKSPPPTTCAGGNGGGRVRYVLFDTPLHPGRLTLVEMDDGSLRVLMDDRPLHRCHWPPTRIRSAVNRFQQIKTALAAARRQGPVH